MRLLFITQVVDTEDLYLGFTTRWIEELAAHTESIEVICLKQGVSSLPKNVRVHSLGKEKAHLIPLKRIVYIIRFLRFIWILRFSYDAVLVHMNQEYVLLGGWFWRLFGKRIYMWRNHYEGSCLTDIAAAFCTSVFCTSRFSYTAKYKKAMVMPVGVDTERFSPGAETERVPRSILFLARMSPSKDPFLLLGALHALAQRGTLFTATFAGSPLPEHEAYYMELVDRAKEYELEDRVRFLPGIPHRMTIDLYRTHEFSVNASRSGMFDKTLFEAAASKTIPLALSKDWEELAGEAYAFQSDVKSLAERLDTWLAESPEKRDAAREHVHGLAITHSLKTLAGRLATILSRAG